LRCEVWPAFDRRKPAKAKPAKPTSIIAQVEGSGTRTGVKRKADSPPGPSSNPTICPMSFMPVASSSVQPVPPDQVHR
jgi:hypothetical protein